MKIRITIPKSAKLVGNELQYKDSSVILPAQFLNKAVREQVIRTISEGFVLEIDIPKGHYKAILSAVIAESELYCNNCHSYTTYDKVVHGTMKLTDDYVKDITFCPNCFQNNCLEDIT